MTKRIPEHIIAKIDPTINKWAIWNDRLKQWVGQEREVGPPAFHTEKAALAWYKEQI